MRIDSKLRENDWILETKSMKRMKESQSNRKVPATRTKEAFSTSHK